ACASDWAEHTDWQTGQVSHADPSLASGTSCLTYPLYICRSFTLFLPPERKPGITDAGTAESRKGIF
ncbi:hypothetical protein ACOT15_16770, partial [Bacteroides fragilis]